MYKYLALVRTTMVNMGFIEVNSRIVKRVKIIMKQRKEGLIVRGATFMQ